MHFQQAVDTINDHFEYVSDDEQYKFFEVWNVMDTSEATWDGDCEDYSLTIMWLMADRNPFLFMWNLFCNTDYRLHQVNVKDMNGGHCVLQYKDMYVDNMMRQWVDKGSPSLDRYIFRFPVYPPLLLGKLILSLPFVLYDIYLKRK